MPAALRRAMPLVYELLAALPGPLFGFTIAMTPTFGCCIFAAITVFHDGSLGSVYSGTIVAAAPVAGGVVVPVVPPGGGVVVPVVPPGGGVVVPVVPPGG